MPVDPSTIQPPKNPNDQYVWGYDPDAGKWVPVDRQAVEGSTLGNLARAAGRGFESLQAGARQMTGINEPEVIQSLQERQAAAAAGAPIAEAVGGYAPEAAGAGLAALATGGLSIPAAIGVEALGAGATTALRPGDLGDRLIAGAVSAGEQALGSAAFRGIVAGVKMGRGILQGTSQRVAAGVEAGAERVRASELQRQAAEAEAAQRAAGEAGNVPVAPEASAQGGLSVGAAQTPADELGGQFSETGRALAQTEAAGADISEDVSVQRLAERAQELGLRTTPGFGSRSGSAARLMQSVHDLNPFGDIGEQMVKTNNQQRLSELLGQSLGIDQPKGSMLLKDLSDAEARIGGKFDYVESRMPLMPQKELGEAWSKLHEVRGVAGRSRGQSFIDDAVSEIDRRKADFMSAAEWMDTRRTMQGEMARLYAQGDTSGGDAIGKAVAAMDRIAERRLRQKAPNLLGYWSDARQQYQVLMAAKRAGALSPTGDVNARTLLGGLKRDASSGGFGLKGPPKGSPAHDLFDALQVVLHNESGVPMTGARMVIRGAARSAGGKVGAGAAGVLGLKSIFD